MALPRLSVIVPVRNEAGAIGRLLGQLQKQTYPAHLFEIIVADGRSTDATRSIVEEIAQASKVSIRLVDNPRIRSGPGRNAGIASATGEVIVFIDGHCEIPSNRLLQDTVLLLEQTGAECLCRPQPLTAYAPMGVGRIIADARASALGHGRDSLIYDMTHTGFVPPASSGATYRRIVFETTGHYDETFDACEDVEFNTRVAAAGFRAYTDPRLAVFYEPRKSFSALFHQMMRYGIGRVRLSRKHKEAASLSQWAPAVLVAAIVMAIGAVLASIYLRNWPVLIPAIPAILFALATVVASIDMARHHGWRHALLGPIAYWMIYIGLGSGMWKELLSPSERAILPSNIPMTSSPASEKQ